MGCLRLTYWQKSLGLKVEKGNLNPLSNSSAGVYRYGFQGQEKDDEVSGSGNSYTAEFWQYDSRLGRRWNVDPVVQFQISSYATFNNNSIYFVDSDGQHPRRGNEIMGIDFRKSFIKSISGDTEYFGKTDPALYKVTSEWVAHTTKVNPTNQKALTLPSKLPQTVKEAKKLLDASKKITGAEFAEPHINSNEWLLASKATQGYTYITFSGTKSGAVSIVENIGEGMENMVTFEYGFILDEKGDSKMIGYFQYNYYQEEVEGEKVWKYNASYTDMLTKKRYETVKGITLEKEKYTPNTKKDILYYDIKDVPEPIIKNNGD